jgi:hypothetical protein
VNMTAYGRYFAGLKRAWQSPALVDLLRFLSTVPAVPQPPDWDPPDDPAPDQTAEVDEAGGPCADPPERVRKTAECP